MRGRGGGVHGRRGGCSSYDGTTKNGVTTSSWASFSHSFGFAFPLLACADGKKPAKQ